MKPQNMTPFIAIKTYSVIKLIYKLTLIAWSLLWSFAYNYYQENFDFKLLDKATAWGILVSVCGYLLFRIDKAEKRNRELQKEKDEENRQRLERAENEWKELNRKYQELLKHKK